MAELVVAGDELVVRLSWWERIAAAHGNVRVPLSSVAYVVAEARGRDHPVPYGVHAHYFSAARRRRPTVYVDLDPPSRLKGLIVSVADPEATAARIRDAKHELRGAEEMRPVRVHARRLWLPWRPRLRLIWAWPRAWAHPVVAYPLAGLHRFDLWQTRTFTGWLRPVAVAVFLLPYLYAQLILLALVADVTILAFGVSIYLVVGEWLLLALMFPFVAVARLASLLPWPLVAVAGPRRWTARVAGWGVSGKAADDAAGALTSGAEPAEPPWSPGERRARIWQL